MSCALKYHNSGRLRKTPLAILVVSVGLLVGCASDRELPDNDANGSDKLKLSPCACEQLDYDGGGYKWVG